MALSVNRDSVYLVPAFYAATSLVDVPKRMFEEIHWLVAGISSLLALSGIMLAYISYKPGKKLQKRFVERREPGEYWVRCHFITGIRMLFITRSFYHFYCYYHKH